MEAAGYVLQEFTRREAEQVSEILDTAVAAILTFVTEGVDKTMNEYNAQVQGGGF
jgi:peptidyl-tRNA hydrolase